MRQLLTQTIDARPLAVGRILLGVASLPLAVEWFRPLLKVASRDSMALPVIDGAGSLPSIVVMLFFGLSVAASAGMILGVAGRLPALLLAAVTALVLLADQQVYSNHMILLLMLSSFMGLSGAHRAYTVAELRRKRRKRSRGDLVPYWPAFLIKAQITTLYFWTAVSKINPQYLSGEVIDANLRGWVPVPESLLPAVSLASIAAEFFLAFALWIPKTRLLGFLVGFGLHFGILAFLTSPAPLIPFAMLMATGYVLFAHDSIERGQWKLPAFAGSRKRAAVSA